MSNILVLPAFFESLRATSLMTLLRGSDTV